MLLVLAILRIRNESAGRNLKIHSFDWVLLIRHGVRDNVIELDLSCQLRAPGKVWCIRDVKSGYSVESTFRLPSQPVAEKHRQVRVS